jgi:hypothetical protein
MTKPAQAAADPAARFCFLPARAKLWIGSIDDPKKQVRAQYNPKELQIDKAISWGEHKARDNRPGHKRTDARPSLQADLELTGAPTRSMTVELLFDGFEEGMSVEPDVRLLEELSSVQDPESGDPDLRRPHHCVVAWGATQDAMRPFRCVIESLSVKYMVWDRNGTPLRAMCTVKLKEAQMMSAARSIPPIDLEVRERRRRRDEAGQDEWEGWDELRRNRHR